MARFVCSLHPVALGSGKPFFTGQRPQMHLDASDRIGPEAIRLVCTLTPARPARPS